MKWSSLLVLPHRQGRLAQLEERHVHTVEVGGSRPPSPTHDISRRSPAAVFVRYFTFLANANVWRPSSVCPRVLTSPVRTLTTSMSVGNWGSWPRS